MKLSSQTTNNSSSNGCSINKDSISDISLSRYNDQNGEASNQQLLLLQQQQQQLQNKENQEIQILQKALLISQIQGNLQFNMLQNLINQVKSQFVFMNEQNILSATASVANSYSALAATAAAAAVAAVSNANSISTLNSTIPSPSEKQIGNFNKQEPSINDSVKQTGSNKFMDDSQANSQEDNIDDMDDQDGSPGISAQRLEKMSQQSAAGFYEAKQHIVFIIENLNINDERLVQQQIQLEMTSPRMVDIFEILIKQFRMLQKTKEEMIQFVMRKAFQFLFNCIQTQSDGKLNLKEANDTCMKYYFSDMLDDSFVLPFRQNSQIKTMNTTFLKQIFSSRKFYEDYKLFLVHFNQLANEDNEKQIDLLAFTIAPLIEERNLKQIESLRRLPWTAQLLDATKKLSISLLEFSDQYNQSNFSQQAVPQKLQQDFNSTLTNLSSFTSPLKLYNNNNNLSNSSLQSPQSIKRKNIIVISPRNNYILQKDAEVDSTNSKPYQKMCTDDQVYNNNLESNLRNFQTENLSIKLISTFQDNMLK